MGRRILLLDDDRRTLEVAGHFLRGRGYEVESFWNPREALAAARKGAFDAVVTDVVLSGMDGFEFCRELKADPSTAGLPVLFASAKVEVADLFLKHFHGRADFLRKPYPREELEARLIRLLTPPRGKSPADKPPAKLPKPAVPGGRR